MAKVKARTIDINYYPHSLKDAYIKFKKLLKQIPDKLKLKECVWNPKDFRFDDFCNYCSKYVWFAIEPNLTENEKEINEKIKSLLIDFFENKIDFNDAKNKNKLIPFLKDYASFSTRDVSTVLDWIVKEYFENCERIGRDPIFYTRLAYFLTKILIVRKELTEEQYILLAPYLYDSPMRSVIIQFIPTIHFASFENDYEWSKGNSDSIALMMTVENTLTDKGIKQAFERD